MTRRLLLPLLLPLILTACGEPEDTGPGQPVAHRRTAFKNILKAFEPMGVRLRSDKYEPEEFILMVKALEQTKDGPWSYFTPESNYPPTHASDKVWSEPQKFEAGRQAFFDGVGRLAQAAETRDKDKVAAAYSALQSTCKDCHQVFKMK